MWCSIPSHNIAARDVSYPKTCVVRVNFKARPNKTTYCFVYTWLHIVLYGCKVQDHEVQVFIGPHFHDVKWSIVCALDDDASWPIMALEHNMLQIEMSRNYYEVQWLYLSLSLIFYLVNGIIRKQERPNTFFFSIFDFRSQTTYCLCLWPNYFEIRLQNEASFIFKVTNLGYFRGKF